MLSNSCICRKLTGALITHIFLLDLRLAHCEQTVLCHVHDAQLRVRYN